MRRRHVVLAVLVVPLACCSKPTAAPAVRPLASPSSKPATPVTRLEPEPLAIEATPSRAPQDFAATLVTLRSACDQTGPSAAAACTEASQRLRLGIGVRRDAEAARALAERACAMDDAAACADLAEMRVRGEGGPVDREEAASLLRTRCARAEFDACLLLHRMIGAGYVRDLRHRDVDAMFLRGCIGTEAPCEAPSERLVSEPGALEGLCRNPAPPRDDRDVRIALLDRMEARGPGGVWVASELRSRERAALLRAVRPFGCGHGVAAAIRYVAPLVREADGSVVALVEWFADQRNNESGYLHETLVRIAQEAIVVAEDEHFFWQYASMGLEGWSRSLASDLDGDGSRDVMLVVPSGFDDTLRHELVFVLSSALQIERLVIAALEGYESHGCFVASSEGPTFLLDVLQRHVDEEEPSRSSCLLGASYGRDGLTRHRSLAAELGAETSIPWRAGSRIQLDSAALRVVAPRGLVEPPSPRPDAEEMRRWDVSDERLFRRDADPFPFTPCPPAPAFALIGTSREADEAPRVRFATNVRVVEDAREPLAFPVRAGRSVCEEIP